MTGIIPADAGSTVLWAVICRLLPDHPRGCGEHWDLMQARGVGWGSSPRMRGALRPARQGGEIRGIIPADAGSTLIWGWENCPTWDHPRGCGEHYGALSQLRAAAGSSPRMRGAPSRRPGMGEYARIIPADAGSTLYQINLDCLHQDHPRGCGEHSLLLNSLSFPKGSSPRMRGALVQEHRVVRGRRIIPADAGSTEQLHLATPGLGDHPRGCGEHDGPA